MVWAFVFWGQGMAERSRILVVEDSRFFRTLVSREVSKRIDAEAVTAESLAESKARVAASATPFNLAPVDIVLPDAPEGEAVDWLLQQGVPSIVFTGVFSDDLRERLLSQHVIDYVVKNTPSSLNYLMGLVEELHRNQGTKVLVVDDSMTARHHIANLLKSYQFQVIEAADGEKGLAVLVADPDIRLVITDHHMPVIDGVSSSGGCGGSHYPRSDGNFRHRQLRDLSWAWRRSGIDAQTRR